MHGSHNGSAAHPLKKDVFFFGKYAEIMLMIMYL